VAGLVVDMIAFNTTAMDKLRSHERSIGVLVKDLLAFRSKADAIYSELSSINTTVLSLKGEYINIEKLVRGDGLQRSGVRLVGQEMHRVKFISSADACFSLCMTHVLCAAATFSSTWYDNCYLFSRGNYTKATGPSPEWTSFVKDVYVSDD
jgi:hypothetical protein